MTTRILASPGVSWTRHVYTPGDQPDGTRDVLLPEVAAQRQCRDIAIRGALSPITSEGLFPPGQEVLGASSIYFCIDVLLPGAAAQCQSHDIARLSNSHPA